MNTGNVYFGEVYEVVKINNYHYIGIELGYVKDAMVMVRKNVFGKRYMKDLNTGEKYNYKVQNKLGALYVSKTSLQRFNDVTNNKENDLSPNKIKKIGNKYLKR